MLIFLRNLALFHITDGFKNLDNLVKDRVKKEVRKGQRELEHVINNTSRHNDGSLNILVVLVIKNLAHLSLLTWPYNYIYINKAI